MSDNVKKEFLFSFILYSINSVSDLPYNGICL